MLAAQVPSGERITGKRKREIEMERKGSEFLISELSWSENSRVLSGTSPETRKAGVAPSYSRDRCSTRLFPVSAQFPLALRRDRERNGERRKKILVIGFRPGVALTSPSRSVMTRYRGDLKTILSNIQDVKKKGHIF